MDYFEALYADREMAKYRVALKRYARKHGIYIFPLPEYKSFLEKYFNN